MPVCKIINILNVYVKICKQWTHHGCDWSRRTHGLGKRSCDPQWSSTACVRYVEWSPGWTRLHRSTSATLSYNRLDVGSTEVQQTHIHRANVIKGRAKLTRHMWSAKCLVLEPQEEPCYMHDRVHFYRNGIFPKQIGFGTKNGNVMLWNVLSSN